MGLKESCFLHGWYVGGVCPGCAAPEEMRRRQSLAGQCTATVVLETLSYSDPGDTLGSIKVYVPFPDDEGRTALYLVDAIAAALRHQSTLRAELERLSDVLRGIACHGHTRPLEMGDGDDGDGHWKRIAQDTCGMAARAVLKDEK